MSPGVPIAVVGMACRFPGAGSLGALADLLWSGRSGIGPVPPERRALWNSSVAEPSAAGLLDGIDSFDRHLFGISANEAPLLDPQQRLILEMAWHALEDAGLSPAGLEGTSAGVYVGAGSFDHAIRMALTGSGRGNPYLPNAVQNAAISGRVSFCLGLTGPSLTVDTACSSGLAAVTLAGDALRLHHCDLALSGGVNVLLTHEAFAALDVTRVLSRSGQTRSFDAAADGFVRSEGCGMLVLKRLPDALADNDRIHALLPGWATGQDGRSNGLSAPSRAAQVQVIGRAMRSAGVTPDDIGAVEAHGSATALGDSIEALALAEAFAGRTRPPAALGSIKSALGHLEAAAGIAGLIKAILMVRDGVVPVQQAFDVPSRRVNWETLPFEIPRATRAWKDDRRMAGVSSFGMSGLNVHMIVSSCHGLLNPSAAPIRAGDGQAHLFLLSAASPAAFVDRAEQLRALLKDPDWALEQLAAAVSRRWAGLSLRAGFLAATLEEARAAADRLILDPPRRMTPLAGQIVVETPLPLSLADLATLRTACPQFTTAPSGTSAVTTVSAGAGDTASILLALHDAGAILIPRAVAPADPAAPGLPGYPFDRIRCWYDDLPFPNGG